MQVLTLMYALAAFARPPLTMLGTSPQDLSVSISTRCETQSSETEAQDFDPTACRTLRLEEMWPFAVVTQYLLIVMIYCRSDEEWDAYALTARYGI